MVHYSWELNNVTKMGYDIFYYDIIQKNKN